MGGRERGNRRMCVQESFRETLPAAAAAVAVARAEGFV